MKPMKDERIIQFCITGIILCGFMHLPEPVVFHHRLDTLGFTVGFVLWLGSMMCWWQLILKRLLPGRVRMCAYLTLVMTIAWFLLRSIRYRIELSPSWSRLLWYSYYIPLLFMTLAFRLASGFAESSRFRPHWNDILCVIVSAVLAGAVLTNDIHGLVFRMETPFTTDAHTYGAGYAAVVVWIGLMLGTGIYRFTRLGSAKGNLRIAVLPALIVVVWGLYLAGLRMADHRSLVLPFNFTEISCTAFLVLWEACLQNGLIPSNRNYREFFIHSRVPAMITDREGALYLRTTSLPKKDRDIDWNVYQLKGGRLYWQEDRESLNRLNEQLQNVGESLAEENDLLAAENTVKEQRYHLAEQSRIYAKIEDAIEPQKAMIRRLLAEDGDHRSIMAKTAVLGAYIKRRSNLQILAQNETYAAVNELVLSIRESLDYLRLSGKLCALDTNVEGMMETELIIGLYDIFEQCVEASYETLNSMMVYLYYRDELEMRVVTDPGFRTHLQYAQKHFYVEYREEEQTAYVIVRLRRTADALH